MGNEAITFNLDQTSRYSTNYDAESVNRIDVIDIASEEYSQEFLGYSVSGDSTTSSQPIVSDSSPSLTPFEGSDFILEEVEAFLRSESVPEGIDHNEIDVEGDILLIEQMLNQDNSSPPSL